MQKAHSTAQPTWLETQMVARRKKLPVVSCRLSVKAGPSTPAGDAPASARDDKAEELPVVSCRLSVRAGPSTPLGCARDDKCRSLDSAPCGRCARDDKAEELPVVSFRLSVRADPSVATRPRDDNFWDSSASSSSPESEPSPASPPSPSGIQTVSTDWPSGKENRYRTVPSEEVNFISIVGWPTE